MRESWCNGHYEFVLSAGAKAKTVTSPLIIPSVLCGVHYYFFVFKSMSFLTFSKSFELSTLIEIYRVALYLFAFLNSFLTLSGRLLCKIFGFQFVTERENNVKRIFLQNADSEYRIFLL